MSTPNPSDKPEALPGVGWSGLLAGGVRLRNRFVNMKAAVLRKGDDGRWRIKQDDGDEWEHTCDILEKYWLIEADS